MFLALDPFHFTSCTLAKSTFLLRRTSAIVIAWSVMVPTLYDTTLRLPPRCFSRDRWLSRGSLVHFSVQSGDCETRYKGRPSIYRYMWRTYSLDLTWVLRPGALPDTNEQWRSYYLPIAGDWNGEGRDVSTYR